MRKTRPLGAVLANTAPPLPAAVSLALALLAAFALGWSSAAPLQAQVSVDDALSGMPLREIGPAVAGGRIADIAVHPRDKSTWYVAVGSGGLWKTVNAGVTWTPVFDDQPSYSIGDVAIDPTSPSVIWVGTGENVSGRHVAWGTGIYRSRDGGSTWENMGLGGTEHIGKILIHPKDGNTLLVAAEGPLWNEGGERGVYKSADGGATWRQVLAVDENTGVTDLEFSPADPRVIYAASYQRRRHVWGFMAGGPNSGIHKSEDGGETWREVTTGLPGGDMGKIGLAVTPAAPDVVYATIEAGDGERGFYRSMDRGESWEHRNSYISGGTGPHYYQEIEASPTDPDLVIQMDVFMRITRDGGATFGPFESGHDKHSDNHALWIDPDNTSHMLAGTDAGLYETFDEGGSWRHFPNMPISQFYKVAVSNHLPFAHILGGAQDLGTLWGPSRTTTTEGIRNSDWYFPMGADGYGVDFDPGDPELFYLMTQQGNLYRVDRRTGEAIQIQPQPASGDPPERWNWDSPVLISPHSNATVYFASQRVWKSEDRGNSWTAISGDLTTNTNRYELPFMGRVWELDALHDNGAMSKYATITAVSESPVAAGTIYAGTDDGLINRTLDGGGGWETAAALPGVPDRSFINDVEAGRHAARTVFAVADAHKIGDYTPYVFRSDDAGASWTSVSGDLPYGAIVWAIQQDHENPDLLFAGVENGLYFSPDAGSTWHRLKGAPTIAFRDLKVQRRDGDLVGATFGRGFHVLDDYDPLRQIAAGALDGEGGVWPVRSAWQYVPNLTNQARGRPTLGTDAYAAPNPPFGAVISYFLPDVPETVRQARQSAERGMRERGEDTPFPGYARLREEAVESGPVALVAISDASGAPVRLVEGPARAGLHRVAWDLRGPAPDPISLASPDFRPPWASDPIGPMAPPGTYSAQLILVTAGGTEEIGEAQTFEVRSAFDVDQEVLAAGSAFQAEVAELRRRAGIASSELEQVQDDLRYMRAAATAVNGPNADLFEMLDAASAEVASISLRLNGDPVRGGLNESSSPTVSGRIGNVMGGHWRTTQLPTATQRTNIEIAASELAGLEDEIAALVAGPMARLQAALEAAGAPWTPGRPIG